MPTQLLPLLSSVRLCVHGLQVMELLHGEDMSVLRDKSRKALSLSRGAVASPFTPLPVAGAAHLALEMLRCIEALHAAGFVHRGPLLCLPPLLVTGTHHTTHHTLLIPHPPLTCLPARLFVPTSDSQTSSRRTSFVDMAPSALRTTFSSACSTSAFRNSFSRTGVSLAGEGRGEGARGRVVASEGSEARPCMRQWQRTSSSHRGVWTTCGACCLCSWTWWRGVCPGPARRGVGSAGRGEARERARDRERGRGGGRGPGWRVVGGVRRLVLAVLRLAAVAVQGRVRGQGGRRLEERAGTRWSR